MQSIITIRDLFRAASESFNGFIFSLLFRSVCLKKNRGKLRMTQMKSEKTIILNYTLITDYHHCLSSERAA